MASLVLTDSSQLSSDSQHLGLMPKIRRLRKGVVPSIFPWKKPDKDPPIEEGFSIARQSMQAITNITDNDSCSVKSEPVWYKEEAISIVEVDLYTRADELLKEEAHQPPEVLHTHVASKYTQTEADTKTSLVVDDAANTTVLKNRRQQVHVERLIGLKMTYKILKSKLNDYYVPLAVELYTTSALANYATEAGVILIK
uniref:Uncharacterized protein n=1 Tax=Timema shepardi TaxID=629360 RepID=A0A7R9AUG8_TIMSH|nr:unnamed protein product [Timema shepardi]